MDKRAEAKQAIADGKWWSELSKYLPWRLHGFTYRQSATFITGKIKDYSDPLRHALVVPALVENRGSLLELTGTQRDQILAAITERGGRKR